MRGLVTDGRGGLRLVDDLPMPKLDDYTALVRTAACGICNGTDLKLVDGHLRNFDTYPAVLGHEATGTVVEAGAKVRSFRVGDQVMRNCLETAGPGCHSLWGSFSEYTVVRDAAAMAADGVAGGEGSVSQQVFPAEINAVDGTMLITLKEVYSALRRLRFPAGATVAIYGGGPVGLAMANCAKLQGAAFVALCDHHDDRLQVARKVGADLAVNAKKQDFVQAVARQAPKLDYVIDCVGRAGIVSAALGMLREDGVIGLYGIGIEEDKPVCWNAGPYNWMLQSVQWPVNAEEAAVNDAVCGHVLSGGIDLSNYVTHRLPIEEFAQGFDLVKTRAGLKVALCF
ncbi:zinc-binding dehydrogenase [Ruminococcaceae bacterium OttesenSCG-928-A11]|nr:zinc-binding dehydrogenase [Ruminococcaceae bacterium OttesenSCG-928-A11]